MRSPAGITQCASVQTVILGIPSGAASPLTQSLDFITNILKLSDNQLCLRYNLNRATISKIRQGINPVRNLLYYFQQLLNVLSDYANIVIDAKSHERCTAITIFLANTILALLGARKIKGKR